MSKLSPGTGFFELDGVPYTKGLLTCFAVEDKVHIRSLAYPTNVNIIKPFTAFRNGDNETFVSAASVVSYFKSIAFNEGGGDGFGVTSNVLTLAEYNAIVDKGNALYFIKA